MLPTVLLADIEMSPVNIVPKVDVHEGQVSLLVQPLRLYLVYLLYRCSDTVDTLATAMTHHGITSVISRLCQHVMLADDEI